MIEKETIEVGYRCIGATTISDYHHKYIIYKNRSGEEFTISGWTDPAGKTEQLPNGKIKVLANMPYDHANPDHPENENTFIRDEYGQPIASQKQYREKIVEADDLSENWRQMVDNARAKDNIYPYDITRQNSNTFADAILREAGLPEPTQDGLWNHLSPGSGKNLDSTLIPRSQEYLQENKSKAISDVLSMDEAIKQPMESQLLGYPGIGLDVLNQPLAANASRSEVIDHAFAALMSDNFDALNEGMNAVYSTDIGKETLQQANQAAIDHDAQQAQIQQASAPVMKMA